MKLVSYYPIQIPLSTSPLYLFSVDASLCAFCAKENVSHTQERIRRYYKEAVSFTQQTNPLFMEAEEQLQAYFSGSLQQFELPITLIGSQFQQRVWQLLQTIPYGHTLSYGDIARQLSLKGARAVGNAVGQNPLPIFIPCHRVLPKNASLGQFHFLDGAKSKAALLDLEKAKYKK